MNTTLSDLLDRFVLVYLDDILIYSTSDDKQNVISDVSLTDFVSMYYMRNLVSVNSVCVRLTTWDISLAAARYVPTLPRLVW